MRLNFTVVVRRFCETIHVFSFFQRFLFPDLPLSIFVHILAKQMRKEERDRVDRVTRADVDTTTRRNASGDVTARVLIASTEIACYRVKQAAAATRNKFTFCWSGRADVCARAHALARIFASVLSFLIPTLSFPCCVQQSVRGDARILFPFPLPKSRSHFAIELTFAR